MHQQVNEQNCEEQIIEAFKVFDTVSNYFFNIYKCKLSIVTLLAES